MREALKRSTSAFRTYKPYQRQAEFHEASLTHRERLLRAGNQQGKSFAGAMEMAYHLTGLYPSWWTGRRFDRPVLAWCAGNTGEATRDNPQRLLFGRVGDWGSGLMPAHLIRQKRPAMGIADLMDYVTIAHVSGGNSTLRLKHYSQGREKWQGPSVDVIWCDEEAPEDIYDEALARTIATRGMIYTTFTPLLGMSEIVRRFLLDDSPDRADINMRLEDAEHIPAEERARVIASFPAHEREARANGVPTLGSGRVFPVAESEIVYDAFDYPKHWSRIGGIDFGWDHPTAAVLVYHDRDADILYVANAYRKREATPVLHAAALKPWGDIPWSWPHDGLQHDKKSGTTLADAYRGHGMDLLPVQAQWDDGGNGVEAGLMEMLERMQTGRLKVARHLHDWIEEFRLYHRKNGVIQKDNDDLLDATRYALMMIRFAKVQREHVPRYRYGSQQSAGWMNA